MNILGALKRKYDNLNEQDLEELRRRKQLNITIDDRLVDELKRLAAEFATPQYVISEHALEVGYFYLNGILRNKKKREVVHNHLINTHLLDSGLDDNESILRIGEKGDSVMFLPLANSVIRNYKSLQRAIRITHKTRDMDYLNKCKRELEISAIKLADCIARHPLDESGDNQIEP
jgi:hypothetical protein